MATGEPLEPISEAEVRAFTAKLQTWGDQLPRKEQALLHLMLEQAQLAEGVDTAGFRALQSQQQTFEGAAMKALVPLIPQRGVKVLNWPSAPRQFR